MAIRYRKVFTGGKLRVARDYRRGYVTERDVRGPIRSILLGRGKPMYSPFHDASLIGGKSLVREPSKGEIIHELDRAFNSWKLKKSGRGIAPLD